jgi:acyl-CoA thioesterase I
MAFAPAAFAAGPPRVAVLGDSLTAGYGLAPDESFPAQLQAALDARGVAAEVINAGVSGDTTAGGLARLDWMLKDKPDAVIVELGANDGLRGLDPAETYANLDAIVTKLHRQNIKVLIAGMKAPPNLGKDYAAEFDSIYPRLARVHDVALYPFFLDGVAAKPDLTQADGLHPTAQGVKKIVEGILPDVLRLIGEAA